MTRTKKNFPARPLRVAVVGAGISGLSAAYTLVKTARAQQLPLNVSLYEAADYIGGHTHTVEFTHAGSTAPVDTGFLVCNQHTYPNLLQLFAELGVPLAASEMSFSVSVPSVGLEWAGHNINTVFAQRSNLFNPAFLGMLRAILRFNRHASAVALATQSDRNGMPANDLSLGDFLAQHQYNEAFRDWYLLPMAGAIWSCSTQQMLDFPATSFIRFCYNHGLLQINQRPQWYTVRGGAREYVQRILAYLADSQTTVQLACPVWQIQRDVVQGTVTLNSAQGKQTYDAVILASHSDQTLAMLGDASLDERALLSDIRYQSNHAVLHTDASLLPLNKRCWAAWNYFSGQFSNPAATSAQAVGVTYLLNRLQPLPFKIPVLVTLNPLRTPDPKKIVAEFTYMHPIFDRSALAAQQRIGEIQGKRLTWFAGAWLGYGFHEDGLIAGRTAAQAVLAQSFPQGNHVS